MFYAVTRLGGEADMSKSSLGIVVYTLGTLVNMKSKKQSTVTQSTTQAEMIATAYGKVQINWLRDLMSEIGIGRGITRRMPNDRLNSVTTFNSGNFQSDSRHLSLLYHWIYEAIANRVVEIKHVAGTQMLADALTKALGGVKLGELVEDIGLGYDHGQDLDSWIYILCLDFFGLGFNGIWNSEEDLRLLFVSLFLFHLVWKALGQRGSVDKGFGPVASLVFYTGGLGHEAGGLPPPLASLAPTSLVCLHQPRLPPW
jgi:hypothetical protein